MDGFLTAAQWIIPIAMVPVAAHGHSPVGALAWLLFIFFKPWAGLILYFLFGTNLVMRRLTKSYCQRLREVRSFSDLAIMEPHVFGLSSEQTEHRLAKMTERLACMPILQGNEVEFIDNGFAVIDRMIADIGKARDHVHLLFYIFNDDEVGRRVAEALAGAAARGVPCRVVVDAFGSRSLNGSLGEWMVKRGIDFQTLMSINPFRRHLTRLDLRNHRKLAVIDGTIAYTGSMNIETKDYDQGRAEAWHDLMVRVTGPVVMQLQLVFGEDWYLATDKLLEGPGIYPVLERGGTVPMQAVPTGPMDPTTVLRDLLIAAVSGARERIIITSPYFIPDESLRVALHLASLRGVSVELVIPFNADHPVVGAVARAHFECLIDGGVNIYFHRGVLHAKTMSVDDEVSLVTTANFDRRSLFLHSELSLFLYGREVTARLRDLQSKYIAHSDKVDPARWKRRSVIRRSRDEILKLLSPVL